MDMDQPKYTFAEISAAAGAKSNTVRGWDHRHNIFARPRGGTGATGKRGAPGQASLLTLRCAYTVALANEIVRYGVLPERAITLAKSFMHFSGDEDRNPGELFLPPDETLLAIFPGLDDPSVLRVSPDEASIRLSDLLMPQAGPYGWRISALVIFVNPIFEHVSDVLRMQRE